MWGGSGVGLGAESGLDWSLAGGRRLGLKLGRAWAWLWLAGNSSLSYSPTIKMAPPSVAAVSPFVS